MFTRHASPTAAHRSHSKPHRSPSKGLPQASTALLSQWLSTL